MIKRTVETGCALLAIGLGCLAHGQGTMQCLISQGGSVTPVTPFAGAEDIVTFYGYGTFPGAPASANTGLEKPDTSILFLYQDTTSGELSLVAIHDSQLEETGGTATFTYTILGDINPVFSVEDDPPEFEDLEYPLTSPFVLDWSWNEINTDGAALTGGLESHEWCITIDAIFPPEGGIRLPGRITDWLFLTPDGPIPLNLQEQSDGSLTGSVTICCGAIQQASIAVSDVVIESAVGTELDGTFCVSNESGGDFTYVMLGDVTVELVSIIRGKRTPLGGTCTITPRASGAILLPNEQVCFEFSCTGLNPDLVDGELKAIVCVDGAVNQLGQVRDKLWCDTSE